MTLTFIVWFQKISLPSLQRVIENTRGGGGGEEDQAIIIKFQS